MLDIIVMIAIGVMIAIPNALWDFILIEKGTSPNHTIETIIRGSILGFLAYLIPGAFSLKALYFTVAASSFWIAFELALNCLRELPWTYVGYTATIDKWTRKLFKRNPGSYLFTVKVTVLITSIIAICLIQHCG